MPQKKKYLLLATAIVSALLIVCAGLWIHYSAIPWSFHGELSQREKDARSALVTAAESWLGCMESDGSHRQIVDLYNSQEILPMDYEVTYTDSWCAAFVSAAAMKAGLTDRIPTECGCERQIGLLQEMGIWQEKDTFFPQRGDLIYYAWDDSPRGDCTGWADHVGIVVGVRWPFVKVIEGNKDDAVGYRTVSIWNSTIRGYGTPDYS